MLLKWIPIGIDFLVSGCLICSRFYVIQKEFLVTYCQVIFGWGNCQGLVYCNVVCLIYQLVCEVCYIMDQDLKFRLLSWFGSSSCVACNFQLSLILCQRYVWLDTVVVHRDGCWFLVSPMQNKTLDSGAFRVVWVVSAQSCHFLSCVEFLLQHSFSLQNKVK